MSHESTFSVESLRTMRNRFIAVFGVLVIGTIITVAMYYVHFEHLWQTVTVALAIATIKALCVAAIFMHLSHPERSISIVLFFTLVFLAGLMGFLVYSLYSVPGGTELSGSMPQKFY